ncbi:CIS tube protein [Methylomonas sp. YC3]
MIAIERGKLIPVNGDNDSPDLDNAIDVQFNPSSLKVSLSNTLKENARNGNSRSAQFVDKSSSNLTIELIFDTTYIEAPGGAGQGSGQTASSAGSNSSAKKAIEQGSDVRLETKKIADTFIKPVEDGKKMKAPKRCLFQWGAFEFLGLVQSFDETLDFFSPEGRPLRATVSLKLSEDRYQFRNRAVEQAARDTPSLSSTGAGPQGGSAQNAAPVPGGSGEGAGNWRDTSLFNGIESPRMPSLSVVAVPSLSLSASVGISGGVGFGLNAGVNISGGISANVSASLSASVSVGGSSVGGSTNSAGGAKTAPQAVPPASPAFKFGNSASLGTGIEGAFSPTGKKGSLNAASIQTGSVSLRVDTAQTVGGVQNGQSVTAATGGRPLSTAAANQAGSATAARKSSGVSVSSLLKAAADSGVGFD